MHGELDKERANRQQEIERITAAAEAAQGEAQRQLAKVEAASKTDREERDAAIKEASQLRGLSDALKTQNAELLSKLGLEEKQQRKN